MQQPLVPLQVLPAQRQLVNKDTLDAVLARE